MRKKRSLVSNTLHARRLLQTSSRKKLCPASCAMHPAKHSSKTEKRLSGEAEVSSFGRRLGRPTKVGRRNGRHHCSYRTAPVEVALAPLFSHGPLRIAAHHNLRAALVVQYSFGLVAKPITHCLRSSGKPSSSSCWCASRRFDQGRLLDRGPKCDNPRAQRCSPLRAAPKGSTSA